MTHTCRRTAAALTAVLALALTACGSSDDSSETPSSPGTTAEPAPEETVDQDELDAALEEMGYPPEADAATEAAYIDALDAIDPRIDKDNPDSAVSRGRDTCRTIHDHPDDRAHQIEQTNIRFSHPDAPDGWGLATAEQILDVVHEHLCPTF
ncbi:hypothetical protein [Streptomyces specialis]|uniref:hypothetical protein n=1 Tax=Streptomyces specialis TaxID=498367 RepID=UPI00131E829E|nr:hypothetical protein [Streptomyces specialis]